MNLMRKLQFKPGMIILLALIVLTPGFYRNQWLAAGKMWFYDWRKIQEGLVIARIVESREIGIFSYGGLMGFGCPAQSNCAWNSYDLDQEYIAYKENGRFQSYSAYTSHPGLQGIFFSLFEQTTGLPPSLNLRLFHGAVSMLSAFVLGVFVYWVFTELGVTAGVFTLVFIASSEWMTLFSGNIFWNIWAFYLPLITSSFYLMKTAKIKSYSLLPFGAILTATMYIKCLFTGFEYITTALVMPTMPFVFYAIRDKWGWSLFLKRFLTGSIGLLAGVVMGLSTLIWQIMQFKTRFQEAVGVIFDALGRRSLGDPTKYVSEAESLNASLLQVLSKYINGRAILIWRTLPINKIVIDVEISYLALFILFICMTVLLLILMKVKIFSGFRSSSSAIIMTTWASVLAPLSWFVIFKAHSFVHTQMNYIVWQMPFTLYGFALCGFGIERFLDMYRGKTSKKLSSPNND